MKKLLSIRSGCRYRNISYHTLHIDNFGSAPPENKYINVEHMRLIFVSLCVYEMRGNHIETRGMQRNSQKRRICLWPLPPPPHLSQNLKWTRIKGGREHLFSSKHGNFQRKQFLKYESKCCLAKQWSVQPHCSQCIVTGHTQMKNNRKTKHRRISRQYQRFM